MSTRLRTALEMAAIFAACTALFYWLLAGQEPAAGAGASRSVLDIDGLYHYKVSRLILQRGPWVDISWLPFTVLGDHGTDHEWLFHALIAPLTLLGNGFRSFALVCAMAGAAVPTAMLPMLRRAGVPLALAFSLAVVCSSDLLPARFLSLRTENLALVFMVAALFALARRSIVWIAVIAFLFMQSYHGVVVLGPMVIVAMAVQAVRERTVSSRPLVAVAVGAFAGLLASPWFPANVRYLVFHTFFKAAVGAGGLVGIEWLPVPMGMLARESWVAHGLLASGIVAALATRAAARQRPLGEDTLAACAMTLVLLAMYHFAWRFAEYYAPFAVISSALLWRDALRRRTVSRPLGATLAGALVLLVAVGAYQGATRVQSALRAHPNDFDAYADMMRYVEARDAAPLVFNSRWSDFQQLVYWSDRARFVSGLDGHFLLYGDPKRFKVWYAIASGGTAERNDNARTIRDTFGAGWAVVPSGDSRLAQALLRDPDAKLALEDRNGWLFRLEARP